MATKKKTIKELNEVDLRKQIVKYLKKNLGVRSKHDLTRKDVDDAYKYIKPRLARSTNVYAFSGFDPVEMLVHEYLDTLFG
jgi:type IV secretory pathway TrbF-like protein